MTENNARLIALLILNNIFQNAAYANLALNEKLNTTKLEDKDRRLVTELVYGTVKAKGTLDWLLEKSVNRPFRKISPIILNILRMAVYQLFYMDKIPASAACNEAVELAKRFGHQGIVSFVNGVLRNMLRNKEQLQFPTREENEPLYVALTYLHPQWLVQRWHYRFGMEDAIRICQYDNLTPPLSFRVNTLRISRKDLLAKLTAEGHSVKPSKWCAEGIVGEKILNFADFMAKYGKFIYIQDESSMLVAGILNPKPNDFVLDVCCAPGGKTTHLAQKMANKGKIIATDIYEHKLRLVDSNAKRLGLTIITTKQQDATVLVPQWQAEADCVLVDAPCSGLGVLRRRAEARWNKVEKELSKFPPVQKKILATAAAYVKPGGRLMYSTCTLEINENSRVVEDFLAKHSDFTKLSFAHPQTGEILTELQILPQKDGIDGFYICLLGRKSEAK